MKLQFCSTMVCDTHCHFFSGRFLELLTQGTRRSPAIGLPPSRRSSDGIRLARPRSSPTAGWPSSIATRSRRAALIASMPGDEASVRTAVARHPTRLVGFFMFNPAAGDVLARGSSRCSRAGMLRVVALFPAMHRYRLDDPVVDDGVRSRRGCGRRGLRPLRGADRRRPQAARPAVAVRSPARRSAGGRGGGCPLSGGAGDHPALRRRVLPRSADGRATVREHPSSTRRARTAG